MLESRYCANIARLDGGRAGEVMIGYFFWHWPSADTALATYERSLLAFHAALRAHRPEGFNSCSVSRVSGTPWIPSGRGYEDRYLVSSFAALGILNDAAVSQQLRTPHDSVARRASGGIAGVYRLKFGDAASSMNRAATWFSKPGGMSYEELTERLEPLFKRGAALWQRQMTLGPTPEYCLDFNGKAELPPGSEPRFIWVEPVKS